MKMSLSVSVNVSARLVFSLFANIACLAHAMHRSVAGE